MPGKNKPKRLDRNRAWRVARRKKRIAKLVSGGSRNRAPRAKKKKGGGESEVESPKSKVRTGATKRKVVEKVAVKKVVKKVVKKEA